MVMRIYTKTGDHGETGLYGGERVGKDHLRVDAYGEVDELNAAIGWVRACMDSYSEPQSVGDIQHILGEIQHLLFELGGQLATSPKRAAPASAICEEDVQGLERTIDAAEAELSPLKQFILPGGSQPAAALHMARCICRRAERRVVHLRAAEPTVSEMPVVFLNRLSDLLFVLARLANHRLRIPDVGWTARTPSGL